MHLRCLNRGLNSTYTWYFGDFRASKQDQLYGDISPHWLRMVSSHRNHITSYSDLCSDRSYLGKQLLLLSEQLFLWDTQVLQPGTRLPPLQSDSLAFLQHIFDFRYV